MAATNAAGSPAVLGAGLAAAASSAALVTNPSIRR